MAAREGLAARRKLRGFTQSGLAEALQVATSTVARWEHGSSTPYARYRGPLAERLGVSLAELNGLLDGGEHVTPSSEVVRAGLGEVRSAGRHNLPVLLTRFVGRRTEIETVQRLLGGSLQVTLVGSGGCGKTRLAVEVARGLLGHCRDGVGWVDLARLAPGGSVAGAAAGAFGVREQPGRSELDGLVAYLRERRVLVVFDNCEHVLDASGAVMERLLGECHGVRLLATSREPVGIGGETVWRVPSLSTPPPTSTAAAARLMGYEAVQLFVDRARAAHPAFLLTGDNADAVARVCARLDGIPLAIEMAAARLPALSADEIAATLVYRLGLLTGTSRSALPQHRTLRASLDWSHGLLDEDERIVFRRLALFVGSFSLHGVQSVCGDERLDADDVLDVLTRLVHKSLVVVDADCPVHRYRLLEIVRQYAAERLAESDDSHATGNRHAAYAVGLVEAVTERLAGGDSESLDLLDVEWANLRAALDWAIERGSRDWPLRLASGLGLYFGARGHLCEGRRYIADALAAGGPEPSTMRARVLWDAGYVAFVTGRVEASSEHAGAALAMAREVGDARTVARALALLGGVEMPRQPARAREHLAASVDLARREGDDWCIAQALGFTTMSWIAQGALGPARASLAAEREVLQRLNAPRRHAWHRLRTAIVALMRGELADAANAVEHARVLAVDVGDPTCLAYAVMYGAEIDGWRGRAARAPEAIAKLDAEFEISASGPIAAMLLHAAAGKSLLATGEVADAEPVLRLAARSAREVNSPQEGACLIALAEVALLRGQNEEARTVADPAIRFAEHLEDHRLSAAAKMRLAAAARGDGDVERARTLCHEALRLQHEGGYLLDVITTMDAIAGLDVEGGEHVRAARLIGATGAARRGLGARRRPVERLREKPDRTRLLRALDRATLRSALREGRALTLDDAIAYAQRGRGARSRPAVGWESLTPVELTIAGLVASGHSNPEIAAKTFVSRATVRTHLTRIFAKLAISNRAELAAQAAQHLPPSPSGDPEK